MTPEKKEKQRIPITRICTYLALALAIALLLMPSSPLARFLRGPAGENRAVLWEASKSGSVGRPVETIVPVTKQEDGRYGLQVPPGEYSLRRWQVVERMDGVEWALVGEPRMPANPNPDHEHMMTVGPPYRASVETTSFPNRLVDLELRLFDSEGTAQRVTVYRNGRIQAPGFVIRDEKDREILADQFGYS